MIGWVVPLVLPEQLRRPLQASRLPDHVGFAGDQADKDEAGNNGELGVAIGARQVRMSRPDHLGGPGSPAEVHLPCRSSPTRCDPEHC
jgi:hypothetical protein